MTQADDAPQRARAARDAQTGSSAAQRRMAQQETWVDLQIRQAMARGAFDDLPGQGKPIPDLGAEHDPDWWLKHLIERERISGVLPPSLQLRKDDAELDGRLDKLTVESEVRREVEDFNERVIRARYTPVDGPPLIPQPRDVEQTVAAWRERLVIRRRAAAPARPTPRPEPRRRRWFRREIRHTDD